MTIVITSPVEQLDFADNEGFQQFLMYLVQMQQLQEQMQTNNSLDALTFGRRADNVPQFQAQRNDPFSGMF